MMKYFDHNLNFEIPRFRYEWKHLTIVFISLMTVYVLTMPRTVTLEDSGTFIMSCYYFGISHPPGFPLHTILGKLFTLIPVGSIAFRVHLLSACFAALSCCCLWWLVKLVVHNTFSRLWAYTAAFVYGFSKTFWSQAIIAEVYTLNTFMFFLLVILSLHFNITKDLKWFKYLALCYGLALSNHWPLIQLSLPALLILVWVNRGLLFRNFSIIFQSLMLCAVGLSPYLIMYHRSHMDPVYSFQGSIEGFQDFWYFVSRKNYASLEASSSATFIDRLYYAGFFIKEIFRQFTWGGGIFACLGFVFQFRKWPLILSLSLSFAFGSMFILIGLLSFDYDFFWEATFSAYPLISYGILVIWMVLGLLMCFEACAQVLGKNLIVVLSCFLVFSVFIKNYALNDRAEDTWAYDFAKATLGSLPKNSIYISHHDWDIGPLGYVHLIEGYRKDIELYNDQSLAFNNRLFESKGIIERGGATEQEQINAIKQTQINTLDKFIRETNKEVFYTNEHMPNPFGHAQCGFYRRVNKNISVGDTSYNLSDAVIRYFNHVVAMPEPKNLWFRVHRTMILGKFAATLTPLVYSADIDIEKKMIYQRMLNQATQHYLGKIRMVNVLIYTGYKDLDFLWGTLLEAEKMIKTSEVTKANASKLYLMKAQVKIAMGDYAAAEKYYLKSIDVFANKKNSSFGQLINYYRSHGLFEKEKAFVEKYPNILI